MAEVTSPGFTLNDLKSPRWYWNSGNTVYAYDYSINGKNYMFIPENYVTKGMKVDSTQYFNQNFLNENTLKTMFTNGIGVDLEGVVNTNPLEKGGLGTKGVLVDYDTLRSTGFLNDKNIPTGGKQYTVGSGRTDGAIRGLTQVDGQYVYALPSQGDRAGVSYINPSSQRIANYTKVRGGWLGEQIVNIAEGFASIPLAPEIISALTGGSPYVYASLKGLQTAGGGGDLDDVIKAGLTAYVAKGGLDGLDPGLNKAVQTAMVAANSNNPLEAVAKLYGQEILEESGVSDAIEDAIAGVVGEDIVNAIKDNENIVNTALDVAKGKDLSEAIVDNLTDDIIDATGAETTNEKALVAAAIKGAEAADQGGDVLGSAAEEYVDRGGDLGDIDVDLDIDSELIAGVGDLLDGLPDIDFNLPDLPDLPDVSLDLPEVALDLPEVNLPELPELPDVSIDLPEVALDLPEINIPDINVDMPELPSVDLPEVALEVPELPELPDVNLPDINIPELPEVALETPELPELPELPDVQMPTVDLMKFAGLLGGLTALSGQQGGQAPKDELGRSAYATSPQFARGLDPLGTIGMFSRNKA